MFFIQMKRPLPDASWKRVWRNADTDDAVFLHEENARIMVSFGRKCTLGHPLEESCIRCLRRIEAGMAAAKRALDPEANSLVLGVPGPTDLPETLALVSPTTEVAFAMQLDYSERLTAEKQILTSTKKSGTFEWPIELVDYTVQCSGCDSFYMRAFSVQLGDGLSEEYTRRLGDATFSFTLDGEAVIKPHPLRALLNQKEIPLSPPGRPCLFAAHALEGTPQAVQLGSAGADVDTTRWLGYMLPSGTIIQAQLKNVPEGGGLVTIKIGWVMGRYTTRAS